MEGAVLQHNSSNFYAYNTPQNAAQRWLRLKKKAAKVIVSSFYLCAIRGDENEPILCSLAAIAFPVCALCVGLLRRQGRLSRFDRRLFSVLFLHDCYFSGLNDTESFVNVFVEEFHSPLNIGEIALPFRCVCACRSVKDCPRMTKPANWRDSIGLKQ